MYIQGDAEEEISSAQHCDIRILQSAKNAQSSLCYLELQG